MPSLSSPPMGHSDVNCEMSARDKTNRQVNMQCKICYNEVKYPQTTDLTNKHLQIKQAERDNSNR